MFTCILIQMLFVLIFVSCVLSLELSFSKINNLREKGEKAQFHINHKTNSHRKSNEEFTRKKQKGSFFKVRPGGELKQIHSDKDVCINMNFLSHVCAKRSLKHKALSD